MSNSQDVRSAKTETLQALEVLQMIIAFFTVGFLLTAIALIWNSQFWIVVIWGGLALLVLLEYFSGFYKLLAEVVLSGAFKTTRLPPLELSIVFMSALLFCLPAVVAHFFWWSDHPVRMAQIYLLVGGLVLAVLMMAIEERIVDRFRESG